MNDFLKLNFKLGETAFDNFRTGGEIRFLVGQLRAFFICGRGRAFQFGNRLFQAADFIAEQVTRIVQDGFFQQPERYA